MYKRKSIFYLLVILCIFLFIGGCTTADDQNQPKTDEQAVDIVVTDDFGNQVKLDHYPERIVSLVPSNTEILFALGLGGKVVGVTTYCDYPEEAKDKPKIGDLTGNVEEIVALEPDLVLAKGILNDDAVNKLRKLDIPVLCLDPESIEGVYRAIELIAQATGTNDKGEEIIGEMKKKIDSVEKKVAKIPAEERLRVFIEVGSDPLYTAGKDTFVHELVTLAGGINIADELSGYQIYSSEAVVKNNPDVILSADSYYVDIKQEIKKRAGWEEINAVQEGKVIYELDTNLLNRPGPRSALALELIAKALYPEIFQD
ncbi:MAG: cobalamin-binding protein [Syntrophomonadaceae bacterium]|nr:cobalamin-binding protein [Thermoanaerobacterales bacterium]NLN21868.1 cobalamin-binding protein [Syntrophomonadaceae bacterium]